MTPRTYLSWSALSTWEFSKEEYRKKYILGEWEPPTKYMTFGKNVAEMLEKRICPEDVKLHHVFNFIPDYPIREHKFNADCKIGKENIRLYCIFDGYDKVNHKIYEVKTGKLWNPRKVRQHGQISFYSYAYWLKYKKIPEFDLVWIGTQEDEEGNVEATGNIEVFPATRKMPELLAMHTRIERCWISIKKMYSDEFKSIT